MQNNSGHRANIVLIISTEEFFLKMTKTYIIITVFVNILHPSISALDGKNICPQDRLCKCYKFSRMVDVICINVERLYPVQSLLWTQFAKTKVNKLMLLEGCTLTSLPGYVFNTSVAMIYSRCPLAHIQVDSFKDAHDLVNINLDMTTFSTIPEGLLNLKSLNTLKINHGKFETFEREPWNLTGLLYLHLPNGKLKAIQKDFLTTSPDTKVLDLAFNMIQFIHPKAFDSLTSLRFINLRSNQITTVDGLFEKLNYKLQILDLYDNKLTSLDNAFHNGTWLMESLNIGNNPLGYINISRSFGYKFRFLRSFYMQHSDFARVDPMILKSFPRLTVLHLEFNKLQGLPAIMLSHLRKLEKVFLNHNEMTSLGELFHATPDLEILNLADNSITSIGNSFNNVFYLKYLNLFRNKIRRVNNGDFRNLQNLRRLYLDRNNIETIEAESFSGLWRLRNLDICHNPGLRQLNNSMHNMVSLLTLSVCSCGIQHIAGDEFLGLDNLQDLRLMDNAITSINGAFRNLRRLRNFNIGNNRISTLSRLTFPEKFNLTKIWIAGNPWKCDCRIIWLIEWLNQTNSSALMDNPSCHSPVRLRGKLLKQLTIHDLTEWPEQCPIFCHCKCVSQIAEAYAEVNCANRNLTHVPLIMPRPLSHLDLSNNSLANVSGLDSVVTKDLISLNLEHNKISVLGNEFPKNLEVLRLADNLMKRFPWSISSNNSLKVVTLSNNPWICDCEAVTFRRWLLIEGDRVTDINNTKCGPMEHFTDLNGKIITFVTESQLCPSKLGLYLGTATGSFGVLLVAAAILSFYRRYGLHVRVWLYSRGYTSFQNDTQDTDKMFDGYLAYCSADTEFAVTTILPGLEDKEPRFKLCVVDRDVTLGEHEVSAVLNPIHDSRRVIMILSREFANDELCMSIFRAAFAQFLEDKVNRLILIKKDDLSSVENVDLGLKVAMNWSNCLTWGENLFWEKLRYAMPKKRTDVTARTVTEVSPPEFPETEMEMEMEIAGQTDEL